MNIKVSEISSLIAKEIKDFKNEIDYSNDVGTVVTIGDGIALLYGLDNAMLGELLLFPNNVYGMVMNLEEDSVGVVILGDDSKIKEGDIVRRTSKVVEVPVGDELLGRVVNALGKEIDGNGPINCKVTSPIEKLAPSIMSRESVNSPLETGIKCIDSVIPIGKGQRELIIGDRQTGKTAIAIDAIINQKGKNVICIYVAIGQKNSSVAKIVDRLNHYGCMDYTIVVNASASESSPMLYIAPFSGVTMAEYWASQGKDVLIVFDDLSKHAVAYRALSLLLKRSPGREAFPGDIFYLHSRLLERCAKLNKEHGGGSITALPIIETQAGDISAYIPTNVISITDGQIFLSTDLFNSGQRPAIDTEHSVSRVGSAAQFKAMKKVSSSLKMTLANFRELQSFTQFGSDIDESTKRIIHRGEVMLEILKQPQYAPVSFIDEVISFFVSKYGFIDDLEKEEVGSFMSELSTYFKNFAGDLLAEIEKSHDINDTQIEKMKEIVSTFIKERELNNGAKSK